MGHKQEARLSKGVKSFTIEQARAIAAALEADPLLTRDAAALDAGASPNALKQAMHRYLHGKCSEAEEELCAIVHRARQGQVMKVLKQGQDAFAAGQRTGWAEWMAAKLDPVNFGQKQALEVSGPEGTPLRYETMSPAELRAEAEKLLGGVPALVLEAPKEISDDE